MYGLKAALISCAICASGLAAAEEAETLNALEPTMQALERLTVPGLQGLSRTDASSPRLLRDGNRLLLDGEQVLGAAYDDIASANRASELAAATDELWDRNSELQRNSLFATAYEHALRNGIASDEVRVKRFDQATLDTRALELLEAGLDRTSFSYTGLSISDAPI